MFQQLSQITLYSVVNSTGVSVLVLVHDGVSEPFNHYHTTWRYSAGCVPLPIPPRHHVETQEVKHSWRHW